MPDDLPELGSLRAGGARTAKAALPVQSASRNQPALSTVLRHFLQRAARRATLPGMIRVFLLSCVVAALLSACSHQQASATSTASSAAPASAATNALAGTPMADYGHDLNKAKNVQNIVDQASAKQAAQIDAATASSSH